MSSWAERVHRRAADFGSVVTSCGHPGSSTPAYPYRLEKVKFGIPLEEVCKNGNIPGPLLVLILKLNKESPNRRDVFRAPGHQGAMKKLIHFLQAGRLVNVDNYSVYTIASVLKKFLRKIPNGVFGRTGENELFAIIELESETEQTERLHKLLTSLPKYTQHLLVLLFGTFRVIASNAAHAGTGMTSEALGVSVAPSFFQSCVSDGKTARMEDVLKFKVATKIMKHIIDKFATHDLFGRDNYEYYARVTGRILKVQDEWICSFQYPPPPRGKVAQQKYALQHSLEAEKTWLQCQCERWGLLAQEESRSTPALLTSSSSALDNSAVSLGVTPEHSFMESCARLSVSLEGPGLFAMTSSPLPVRKTLNHSRDGIDGDDDEDDNDDVDNYDEDQNSGQANDNDNTIHYCGNDADLTAELDLDIEGDDDDKDEEEDDQKYEKFNNGRKNGNFYISSNYERIRKLGRLTMKTERGENKTVRGESLATNDNLDDVDGDGDGEMRSAGKRRFRQYKKNTPNSSSAQMRVQMQQQRRLRSTNSGSKSLDDENCQYIDDYEFINKSNSRINNAATTSNTVIKTIPDSVASTMKGRFCSRCKHGIRHSSSCSSSNVSTGGTNTNGSGMTMEELRAVNRYAESTKSLSYLPQVHERQAARMRTRSEWFLGPKDDDILCVDDIIQIPANTCSNCYLQQQQQQQQQQNQHEHEYPVGYLGGGSTRDMRHSERSAVSNVSSPMQDQAAGVLNNTTFLYYKQPTSQQPHQHQQHQLQRQSFHLAPEHMDTDEECFQGASASLHSMQQPKATRKIPTTSTVASSGCADVAVGDGGCPAMLLDNNYGRYNFVDDKNLKNSTSTFTNTTTTITTTTTTTTDNHNKENNNNNIANNNSNNNNNNKSNSNYYTSNNRHHMTKISLNKCHSMELMHQQMQQLQEQEQEQEQQTATTTHLQHLQHYEHKPTNHHMHANHNIANHYFSIEPLLKANRKNKESIECHEDEKKKEGEEGVFYVTSSKLSYHSPRQDDNSCSFINTKINPNIANTNNTANANVTAATRLSNPIANCNDALINGEIDYEFTSRFRHSTPIMQRRRLRQQQALIRQRSPSQSSSLYQSFNASLQAPMTTASAGRYSNIQQRLDLNNSTRRSVNGDSGGTGGSVVGNIRLSNSAESVQYMHKRPSTRRILLGANIPRQYPLRSSLKRHKEKQVGLATTAAIIATTTALTAATANTTTSNIRSLTVPAGILNNPLSNAGHNNGNNESCATESSITFKAPRL